MLGSASKKVLAVDSSKFDKVAFSKICPITDFDVVVTDEKPADQWIEYFKEQGVSLLYPDSN
jgi:DeoR/GlpR family transcriptional regulator of sugar metabolism